MNDENMKVIEINGIKMEVDLRQAKRIDTFRVGDKVKVLEKDGNNVFLGVIIGYENFESMPTIVVAYVDASYWKSDITIIYYNENSRKKYELIADTITGIIKVEKDAINERFDRDINSKKNDLAEIIAKKTFFNDRFGQLFEDMK